MIIRIIMLALSILLISLLSVETLEHHVPAIVAYAALLTLTLSTSIIQR